MSLFPVSLTLNPTIFDIRILMWWGNSISIIYVIVHTDLQKQFFLILVMTTNTGNKCQEQLLFLNYPPMTRKLFHAYGVLCFLRLTQHTIVTLDSVYIFSWLASKGFLHIPNLCVWFIFMACRQNTCCLRSLYHADNSGNTIKLLNTI